MMELRIILRCEKLIDFEMLYNAIFKEHMAFHQFFPHIQENQFCHNNRQFFTKLMECVKVVAIYWLTVVLFFILSVHSVPSVQEDYFS